jgi:hypothetical protein
MAGRVNTGLNLLVFVAAFADPIPSEFYEFYPNKLDMAKGRWSTGENSCPFWSVCIASRQEGNMSLWILAF